MQLECSCGDGCAPCNKCDTPICECYCDFDFREEEEEKDLISDDDQDW